MIKEHIDDYRKKKDKKKKKIDEFELLAFCTFIYVDNKSARTHTCVCEIQLIIVFKMKQVVP